MKIIEPKVELWKQGDDAKAHVARCARVCYGKETGNDEATIKRFYKEDNYIRLQPENDNMKPIIIKDCSILGKLVGLFRSY